MLDISEEKLDIPDISYDSVISMPSIDLQKYCRDLAIISNQVNISSVESKFILLCVVFFSNEIFTSLFHFLTHRVTS